MCSAGAETAVGARAGLRVWGACGGGVEAWVCSGSGQTPLVAFEAVNLVNTGCVVGTSLAMKSIRIGFEPSLMPRGFDTIFIAGKLGNSLNKQLPDAAVRDFIHKVCVIVPVVKITDHRNGQCVRRPYSENNALTAVPVHKV